MDSNTSWLTGQIASELGEGWTASHRDEDPEAVVRPGDPGGKLDGPDGAVLYARLQWNDKRRLVVAGSFPRFSVYRRRFEISARIDRGAEVIAREIKSRLLPDYQREMAALTATLERERTEAGQREALADKFVGLFKRGSVSRPGRLASREALDIVLHGDEVRSRGWRAEVLIDGDASRVKKLEISGLHAETALLLLEVLAGA